LRHRAVAHPLSLTAILCSSPNSFWRVSAVLSKMRVSLCLTRHGTQQALRGRPIMMTKYSGRRTTLNVLVCELAQRHSRGDVTITPLMNVTASAAQAGPCPAADRKTGPPPHFGRRLDGTILGIRRLRNLSVPFRLSPGGRGGLILKWVPIPQAVASKSVRGRFSVASRPLVVDFLCPRWCLPALVAPIAKIGSALSA